MSSLLDFVPDDVEVYYAGYTFNSSVISNFSVRTIPSEDGRAAVYKEYTATFQFVIFSDSPANYSGSGTRCDEEAELMRRALLAPAGHLRIHGSGIGDITLNEPGGGGLRDAKWGPWPQSLNYLKNLGNGNAWRGSWTVLFRIPCDDDGSRSDGLASLWYDLTWQRGIDGLHTITTTGGLTINVTREGVDSRTVPDVAENYRSVLDARSPPDGYERTESHRLSTDRTRLDFTWTDTEHSEPRPNGVADLDFTTRLQAVSGGKGPGAGVVTFQRWNYSIDGTVTMHRGIPDEYAVPAITAILTSQLTAIYARYLRAIMIREQYVVLPIRFDLEARRAGKAGRHNSTRFSASYRIIGTRTLGEMIEDSGLWKPVTGTTYAAWTGSVRNIRQGQRPSYDVEEDIIIDSCPGPDSLVAANDAPSLVPRDRKPDTRKTGELVPKQGGWTRWRNILIFEEDQLIVRHKPNLPEPVRVPGNPPERTLIGGLTLITGGTTRPTPPAAPPTGNRAPDAAGKAGAIRADIGPPGFSMNQGTMPRDRFQRTGAPTRTIWMVGEAERYGAEIPIPKLTTVGGVEVCELERIGCIEDREAINDGPTRHTVGWAICYAVGSTPAKLPQLADPVSDLDGKP